MAHIAAHLKCGNHPGGDSAALDIHQLPLPLLPPGISVPVFVTKVAQDVKLI